MTDWIEKNEYQSWADVIRSDQVPTNRIIQIMEENPSFKKWYTDKYMETK